MKPILRKRFMKKLTRERVVPIKTARVPALSGGSRCRSPGWPNSAINKRIRARRFSLELKND